MMEDYEEVLHDRDRSEPRRPQWQCIDTIPAPGRTANRAALASVKPKTGR